MVTGKIAALLMVLVMFTFVLTVLTMYSVKSSENIFTLTETKRIIAIGDLHGNYNAFKNILNFTNYSPNDTLIQTGDLIDRGDDTIKVLDFFIENRDTNVIQILGNHE